MTVERLLSDLVALLDVEDDDATDEMSERVLAVQESVRPGIPAWASSGCANHRGVVSTMSEQYVLLVEVDTRAAGGRAPAVTEAIGDTGATRSLIDMELARSMGLPIQRAKGTDCGTYFGPGSEERPYVGRVIGPITLRFNKEVTIELRELKVIAHNEPLLLIGADVLCGGRSGWSYRSIGVGPTGRGVLTFANGRRTVAVPLVNAPVYGRPRFVSSPDTIADTGGPAPAANP